MQRLAGLMLALASATVVSWVFAIGVTETDPGNYVGVKSCRLCHRHPDTGDQYGKWKAGPHARAFETLAGPEAKAVAAGLGIGDPGTSGKCLKCHATAYHFSESLQTRNVAVKDGVTCESCHGPGRHYRAVFVMKDRRKCMEKGMIYPATLSCTMCHNEQSPSWTPGRYTSSDGRKVGFDVEQACKKIAHPNPAARK
jgi:hypothetical protein